ncbi:MAG: ATP-binding cassette domain-containing protein, partial [Chloroflexi bacterium]|nr:ATP-binding cassette domain-containing protein [Chloroflexota bacterium]
GVPFHERFIQVMSLPGSTPDARVRHPVGKLDQGIEFRRVWFRYSDHHPWTLRGIDLLIPAGRCLALVGANGSGKSTLVKLLTRMYDPTVGEILWDGRDLREFDPIELRARMAAVFQDFARYDLTAHENIGVGDCERIGDPLRVCRAAMRSGIDDVIRNLPHGYQTVLSRWLAKGEVGVDLSGGEWQKIALARMLARDADLLIMDEPTAALDSQAEQEMYDHFISVIRGHTTVLISHRFSTVRMADIIAVIESGRVTEYGSHSQLASSQGVYARLYNLQASRYL